MLSKLVAVAVSPLGTAMVLIAAATAARRLSRPRAASWLGVGGFVWLWLWATPVASDGLRGWLEAQAGPRTAGAVAAAPVAVVLGAGDWSPHPPLRPEPDLNAAADRVWHAARLYHAGKVQHVLLSGGTTRAGTEPEAATMQRLLVALGVPPSAIWLEERSVNTTTNASESAALLGARGVGTIVLVTSALHMPRARALFERQGLAVHPAPTDFEVVERPFDLLRVLPDAEALEGSGRAFKEVVGRWVGR